MPVSPLAGNAFYAPKKLRRNGRFATCLRRFYLLWRKA